MRIAVITFHRAFNCGAMLQSWAMKTVLERMGHTVEFPRCNFVGDIRRWRFSPFRQLLRAGLKNFLRELRYNVYSIGSEDRSRRGFREFRRKFLPERDCRPGDFSRYYDAVVIGSDQVWAKNITREWTELFLGESIPPELPIVFYSASAGDVLPDADILSRQLAAAKRAKAASVRERALGGALGSLDAVCDPSLLLRAEEYSTIEIDPGIRERYLYSYAALPSSFLMETAREAAADLDLRPIVTPIGQYSRFRAPDGLTYGVSPGLMVGYQRSAAAVITDSFHGTAFALLHGRPFVSLARTNDASTRIGDLLSRLGLSERLITPGTPRERVAGLLRTPVPEAAMTKLREFSAESARWLAEGLAKCERTGR